MARQVIRKHGDLEIDEDPGFQNASWLGERLAWAGLALVLLAGLMGVFGHGPLSRGRASAADGALEIAYPKVARLDAPEQLELKFRATGQDAATLQLGADFSRDFLVLRVQPEPRSQRTRRDGMDLQFDVAPGGGEQLVVVHLRPRRPGLPIRTSVGLGGAPPVELATFVLP